MLGRTGQPGRGQQGADFVAVQADRVRFVVESRPADMGGG